MTRKVETGACSPSPGGAAEDHLPVDTNNNNDNNYREETASDKNNNSGSDSSNVCDAETKVCLKYGLRPRSLQHRSHHFDDIDIECDKPPRRRNIGEARKVGGSRRNLKPRHLSRYRRKNANARERDRMKQINVAFESLKGVLPVVTPNRGCGSPSGEDVGTTTITKIGTLRLAAGYIQALQDILDADERGETTDDAGSAYSWLLSSLLQEEQNEHVNQAEYSNDNNDWALPYFINQCKRSLPTDIPKVESPRLSSSGTLQQGGILDPPLKRPDIPKVESPWFSSGTLQQGITLDPPLKRPKQESHHEFLDYINEEKVTFIYTESNELDVDHLGPYPSLTDADTLSLLLDQKPNTVPLYDTSLV